MINELAKGESDDRCILAGEHTKLQMDQSTA
jgi:hypothetical protein